MKKTFWIIICSLFLYVQFLMETYLINGIYFRYEYDRTAGNSYTDNFFNYFLFYAGLFHFLLLMPFVLLISFLLRNSVRCNFLWQASLISGIIAFFIRFIVMWTVGWAGGHWDVLIPFSTAAFIIGFLFPILYRTFSKQPLFNERFY